MLQDQSAQPVLSRQRLATPVDQQHAWCADGLARLQYQAQAFHAGLQARLLALAVDLHGPLPGPPQGDDQAIAAAALQVHERQPVHRGAPLPARSQAQAGTAFADGLQRLALELEIAWRLEGAGRPVEKSVAVAAPDQVQGGQVGQQRRAPGSRVAEVRHPLEGRRVAELGQFEAADDTRLRIRVGEGVDVARRRGAANVRPAGPREEGSRRFFPEAERQRRQRRARGQGRHAGPQDVRLGGRAADRVHHLAQRLHARFPRVRRISG